MAAQDSRFVGTGRDDALTGTTANDSLKGVAGDDMLAGGLGNDSLDGGVGDDVLDGGRGSDLLDGGHGSDTFVFSFTQVLATFPEEGSTEAMVLLRLGHDVVADFEVGVDRIAVVSQDDLPGFPELSDFVGLFEQDANGDGVADTVIRVDWVADTGIHYTDPGSSITLLGVSGVSLAQLLA